MKFAQLNADTIALELKTKESQDRFTPTGIQPVPGSVADFAKFIANERALTGTPSKKTGRFRAPFVVLCQVNFLYCAVTVTSSMRNDVATVESSMPSK